MAIIGFPTHIKQEKTCLQRDAASRFFRDWCRKALNRSPRDLRIGRLRSNASFLPAFFQEPVGIGSGRGGGIYGDNGGKG